MYKKVSSQKALQMPKYHIISVPILNGADIICPRKKLAAHTKLVP